MTDDEKLLCDVTQSDNIQEDEFDTIYYYAMVIIDSISSLFRNDGESSSSRFHVDLNKMDVVKFFTGMVIGCTHVYNYLTKDNKTALEFTYVCNQLIVQHMVQNSKDMLEEETD